LNGVDTINNFNAAGLATDDVLNANSFLTAAVSNTVAANSVAGLDLSGVANYGVMYNQATLATTDISFGAAAAGKVGVEASSKSVVLVSADVDGLADASNTAYDMYYVVAGATAVTSVTKVATINSTAELNASSLVPVLGTAAGNVLTGTAASDTINGLAGADTISGAAGNDFLVGGEDADVITGGAGNDSIDLTETVAAIDKVVFDGAVLLAAASVSTQLTANGLDTIIGFGAIDTINVAALGDGTTGAGLADVVAAAAANSLALTTDRSIVINATGLAASLTTLGTAVITDWTNLTQVAAYLDELVTVTASNQHNVIVFNNTSGANTTTYVYTLSNVGADVTVDAADIGLVGIITHAAGSMVAAQVVYA
jgi:Ca2+-binding RTX toxin-like protein